MFTLQSCNPDDTENNKELLETNINPDAQLTIYWDRLYNRVADSEPEMEFGNRVCEIAERVSNPHFSNILTFDGDNVIFDIYGNIPGTKPHWRDSPIAGGKLIRHFDMMNAGLNQEEWTAVIASKENQNYVIFYPSCIDNDNCGEVYGYVYARFSTAAASSFSDDWIRLMIGLRWHNVRGTLDEQTKQNYVDLNPQVSQFEFDEYLDAVEADVEENVLDNMPGYPYKEFKRGFWRKFQEKNKVSRAKFVTERQGLIVYMLEFFDKRFAQQYFGPHGLDVEEIKHFKNSNSGYTHIDTLKGQHLDLYLEFVDMNYNGVLIDGIKGLNIMCPVMSDRWGTYVHAPPGWAGGGWR